MMSHPYEDDINKMFDTMCATLGLVFERDFYDEDYDDDKDVTIVADVPYVEVIE